MQVDDWANAALLGSFVIELLGRQIGTGEEQQATASKREATIVIIYACGPGKIYRAQNRTDEHACTLTDRLTGGTFRLSTGVELLQE
jgi:hypothetical protein